MTVDSFHTVSEKCRWECSGFLRCEEEGIWSIKELFCFILTRLESSLVSAVLLRSESASRGSGFLLCKEECSEWCLSFLLISLVLGSSATSELAVVFEPFLSLESVFFTLLPSSLAVCSAGINCLEWVEESWTSMLRGLDFCAASTPSCFWTDSSGLDFSIFDVEMVAVLSEGEDSLLCLPSPWENEESQTPPLWGSAFCGLCMPSRRLIPEPVDGSSGLAANGGPDSLFCDPPAALAEYCLRRTCQAMLVTAETVRNWWITFRGMK